MTDITRKSTEQKGAEAKVEGFRRDLGPFVVAAETTRMPMIFTDAKAAGHPIIFANDAYLALTGYDRAEVLGKPFGFVLAEPAPQAELKAAFGGADDSFDAPLRGKDGAIFWTAVFISPVRSEAREIVQHFASFANLTRHKQEE